MLPHLDGCDRQQGQSQNCKCQTAALGTTQCLAKLLEMELQKKDGHGSFELQRIQFHLEAKHICYTYFSHTSMTKSGNVNRKYLLDPTACKSCLQVLRIFGQPGWHFCHCIFWALQVPVPAGCVPGGGAVHKSSHCLQDG